MHTKEYSTDIGGKTLTATFTNLADQADGSVILRYGNSVVLATAVMSEGKREGIDFFPLSVEYEEKFYAAGQILGSRFMRREGRPSDEAVLSGRAVDRTIRPLFDHDIRNEVQVVITILSIDEDDPDVLAINAASLALATSNIPWNGPVSAVRIGRHATADWAVNPTYTFRRDGEELVDLLACGKDNMINMIEIGAHEADESVVTEGLQRAQVEIEKFQEFQTGIIADIGKEKRVVETAQASDEVKTLFENEIEPHIDTALFSGTPGKEHISALVEKWKGILKEQLPDENMGLAMKLLDHAIDTHLHHGALERNVRADGRAMDEVRPLFAQAGGIAPMLHGSGVFYRGGTHVFSALTLGGPQDSLIIDGMEVQTKKRFMHHYNFPPFSVGETGRVGGFNRRMIGHGALAEKALVPVIPPVEIFPYTVRIVSEALASNGSTSMGSVCASTLALMDAGVPIKAPVAGIAMGLMMKSESEYKILTDIQGPEDHHGDMDFKVAGTKDGVTAIQMDIKVNGVPLSILSEALGQARTARLSILETITGAISEPRPELSPLAPRIEIVKIPKEKIGLVIGGGGKTVTAIKELTETEIEIEDDGSVFITGKDGGTDRARELIEQITREYHAGEKFQGEVTRLMDFGAFVRLGTASPLGDNFDSEGLVHISEIAPFRINAVSDVVAVGETVPVVVKEIDEHGRINLSIKDADPEFATKKGIQPAPPKPHDHEPRQHKPQGHGR